MFLPVSRSALRLLWSTLVWALIGFSHQSVGQIYSANFSDAKWSAQSGHFACSLTHKIPSFGSARFTRNAGAAELLELQHSGRAFPAGAVRIESMPPVWRSDLGSEFLGQAQVNEAKPMQIKANLEVISKTLGQGTNVVFSSVRMSSEGASVRVVLEAHNFSAAFGRYRQCIVDLIPYTFDQLSRTVAFYDREDDHLSTMTKSQLDRIVRYAKADPRVLGIIVDAHSDKRDTLDDSEVAAKQQAEWITAYLIEKGLGVSTISTRWHGDRFPVANNYTKAGQAKNRRVTVRMENESSRKAMEKKITAIKAAEQKAAEKAAQAQSPSNSSVLPINLQQLEKMVEQQNLTSGKQPDITSLR